MVQDLAQVMSCTVGLGGQNGGGGSTECVQAGEWSKRIGFDVSSHSPMRRLAHLFTAGSDGEAASLYLMARRRSWRLYQTIYCCSARSKCWVIWEEMGRTASGSATIVLSACVFYNVKWEQFCEAKIPALQNSQSFFFQKQKTRAQGWYGSSKLNQEVY